MMKTTTIVTLGILSTASSIGCMNFGQRDPVPPPTVFNPSGGEVSQVSYEEEGVQRGQSPEAESASGNSWWDPTGVGAKTLEVTGNNSENKALAKKLFTQAEALYEQGMAAQGKDRSSKLNEAAGLFKRAAVYAPDSTIEEDSLMYSGECYFFLDNYPEATKQYDQLVKKYQNSKHLDAVGARRFKLARYWLDRHSKERSWAIQPNLTDEQLPLFDRFGNAIKLFDLIRLDDPTGDLADDATLAAANAHFREGNFESADRFYTDLRENFPTSEHQFTAHYLGVVTKLKVYQGPEYDGKPLEEAEKLLTRIKRQFPDKTQENMKVIEKLDFDIRAAQAERLWQKAAFYDGRREYQGAYHYYSQVIEKFPTSNMAEAAKKRIDEIKGRPASPTPPGEFLYSWLERKKDLPIPSQTPIENIATRPDDETESR
ncbi:Outer membrane protein assembly factor BamD [Bremerella volcania]|uniref:Outer membrane protein assembly factor BamD n=1 Tax=Bremerella volcania TaxID=2527984 RepID=A0A518CCT8_9BACT|nr:outer membrane protein assembly factor BamD [Bremerella volcania]QDU77014.1 Outer membrane protein assembly factor BamD [Bremerella volcania]